MEYLGAVQSVAQSLFDALQNEPLKEMCSIWGYESNLENLQCTVDTIKAVFRDVEYKQEQGELSHQAHLWVDQLKDALYDADDLLDKFVTLAEQKQLRAKDAEDDNIFKKVRRLFSFDNPVLVAFNMYQGIKEVRNKLDGIAQDHNRFGFKLDSQPIRRRREETCSYVYAQDIVGREDDVENIVGRLLDPNVQQDTSCLTIVGIGGLGKTTLAQLVYNDLRIKETFPLRLWTCVADQDTKNLDVKATLCKILHSATGNNHEHSSMDHLQRQLQEQLARNKYFLVLDDVWNEVRDQWLELAKFLMSGLKGSWIVVTTRSQETAKAVGDEYPYNLKGLSKEDSWRLFMRTAFGQRVEQANPDLVEIGEEIVEKCANVPLAIRVVGTLLYGQGKNKWLSIKEVGLGRIKQGEKGIEPILKFSYHHLESPLKICFGYCAIFPKGYQIEKEMLISLWIAQGYVVPFDKGQSVEDAGEEYFLILLRRCFFQDVSKYKNGEICSFKVHDLIYDLAQEVAGKEMPEANYNPNNLNNNIRHLFHLGKGGGTKSLFTGTKIRTYLRVGYSWPESPVAFGTILANWTSLRALGLSYSRMTDLPSELGELQHLRYLDLSRNGELETLPNSITKLHNLQFLDLNWCQKLKELPKDLGKLTKLRVLDTTNCMSLAHMPRGVGKLSCLWKLPFFVVGEKSCSKEGVQLAHHVEEIKALENLKGNLRIQIYIPTNAKYAMESGRKRGCLSQHLSEIVIQFPEMTFDDIDEELLEDLKPHPNLRKLKLYDYGGRRMPNWAREDNLAISLPNLVRLTLWSCKRLQQLPSLRKLRNLKSLNLYCLDELEYIENTATWESQIFFPSLEQLELYEMPKLTAWWSNHEITDINNHRGCRLLPSFPRLSKLGITRCPNLTRFPPCPAMKYLNCNEVLRIEIDTESGNSKLSESKQSKRRRGRRRGRG